jgi:hypothetical protein
VDFGADGSIQHAEFDTGCPDCETGLYLYDKDGRSIDGKGGFPPGARLVVLSNEWSWFEER